MKLRHELKYSVPLEVARELFKDLELFCVPDPFTGENGWYEVASLYYDTADFRFYWDREESVGYRRKVRIRSYNSEEGCKGMFLEIKEKHRNLVSKKRLSIPVLSEQAIGTRHDQLPLDYILDQLEDSAEVREVRYLHRSLNLQPVALVRYVRDILMSERDKGLRITYDRRLTTGGENLFGYDWTREQFIHSPHSGILEIKANSGIPVWLQTILARYELTQSRFSKYCLAVKCLYGSAPRFLGAPSEVITSRSVIEEEPLRVVSGL